MELEKILERYPGKIAVMGNINIDLLSRGSVEAVVGETKRVLATVSCIGPHIMSSANTIAAWVKPENFLAMVRTTQQFGRYPIESAGARPPSISPVTGSQGAPNGIR